MSKSLIPTERIEKSILLIRGKKVMLDADLAELYAVKTKNLVKAVKRNIGRFPTDFMFQLTKQEVANLKSQCANSRSSWGVRRTLPFAFTEHGAVMLANVLNSEIAHQASIHVVRAFIHLREIAITHKDLVRKINDMERKYDTKFKVLFDAIRELMSPARTQKREVGFRVADKKNGD